MSTVTALGAQDLAWGFDAEGPSYYVKHVGYGRRIRVDPSPAYSHDSQLVQGVLARVEAAFPLKCPPAFFLLSHEEIGRVNGWTQIEYDYSAKKENGRYPAHPMIVLSGKRIPIHPAMTRYLVAHEYGHAVEYEIAREKDPQEADRAVSNLLSAYAEMRGIKAPNYYGPGTWHASPGEVFANDFRIVVCGIEAEFWPHEVPHPLRTPEVQKWWDDVRGISSGVAA